MCLLVILAGFLAALASCAWITVQHRLRHLMRCPNAGNVVKELCVGTGPCGELRYPAYQVSVAPCHFVYCTKTSLSVHHLQELLAAILVRHVQDVNRR